METLLLALWSVEWTDIWSYRTVLLHVRACSPWKKTTLISHYLYFELKLKIGLFKYFIKEFIDSTLLFSPVVWTFFRHRKKRKASDRTDEIKNTFRLLQSINQKTIRIVSVLIKNMWTLRTGAMNLDRWPSDGSS